MNRITIELEDEHTEAAARLVELAGVEIPNFTSPAFPRGSDRARFCTSAAAALLAVAAANIEPDTRSMDDDTAADAESALADVVDALALVHRSGVREPTHGETMADFFRSFDGRTHADRRPVGASIPWESENA